MATAKSASVKAIELARSVFESIQGGLGLLKFSVDSLVPTNGSPTEESQKWDIVCSFFETLGSSAPSKYKASVDLTTNTVSIEKIDGGHSPVEGKYVITKTDKSGK
jgi:hypothetical protein